MYEVKKVKITNASGLKKVASILNACGKDMAIKNNLHHWDNPYIMSLAIVYYCALKNDIYLVSDKKQQVATFMTKLQGNNLHFEKLGTLPVESGKGIGSYCMKMIEELAKRSGCKKVVMEVYEASRHAVSFYEHKGYKTIGMTNTLKYKEVKMEKCI